MATVLRFPVLLAHTEVSTWGAREHQSIDYAYVLNFTAYLFLFPLDSHAYSDPCRLALQQCSWTAVYYEW